ncbi:MAG: hypothetical protein IT381_25195 [Deltaproteobacteria bacterium]|nr:hypothetical protein [Deltaproteobacteria bacterium]
MKSATADGLDWAALLRNAKVVDLAAVRQMREAHRALFSFDGPPEIGAFVRLFRLTGLFAFFAMEQRRFPILNRAFADLQWVAQHPDADEFVLASWLYFDLPVTEDGRTLVEAFAAEIAPENEDMRRFVNITTKSRFGIYADTGGTRSTHRLQELLTRRRVTVTRGVDADPGELFFARIIDTGGMRFMLGNTRGWPASYVGTVTAMMMTRIAASVAAEEAVGEAHEKFMKLSGPYWFSVLYTASDDDLVLDPEHHLTYRDGPVPELSLPSRAKHAPRATP